MSHVTGLCLGGPSRPTALAVLDQGYAAGEVTYSVRHLRRWPPGEPYAAVFAEVAGLFAEAPLAGSALAVDHTGADRPAVELLERSIPGAGVVPARLGAGHKATADGEGGWAVPRAELAAVLRVLLQGGRLLVAGALPDAAALLRELGAFRVRAASADAVPGRGEGPGESLALAVAVAAWEGERRGPPAPGRPLVLGLGPGWRLGW